MGPARSATRDALEMSGLLDSSQSPDQLTITKVVINLNLRSREPADETRMVEGNYEVLPEADNPE